MQPVVVMMPGRSHLVILFQNNAWNILLLETGSHCETRWSRTNHNDMTIHAKPISFFEQPFHFGEQVFDRERFDEIVICAGANRNNFAIRVIKGSNDHYRRMLEFL